MENQVDRKGDGMSLIQVIYIVLIWAIPILGSWYSFRKMGKEKQIELIKEIRHPLSILGIIPIFIGLLVFLTGSVSASGIEVLRHLGIGLTFFGWFVNWLVGLIKGEEKAFKSIVMILIGVSVLIAYIYLF
ncbi:hypothetical protein MHH81_10910 [Psychrobacillus sp. FSL H8-0484]|uniref:hypothetical protein n=1 Tax=Psychrobacillus sp. FSL H8-0484 TaxID=2921390 RepID=UPI0030F84818